MSNFPVDKMHSHMHTLSMTAQEIRDKRVALGLTLQEMAHKLEVCESTVWRWEQGKNTPTKRLQKAILRLK